MQTLKHSEQSQRQTVTVKKSGKRGYLRPMLSSMRATGWPGPHAASGPHVAQGLISSGPIKLA